MFGFIKKLFGGKPAEVSAEAPYKVEEVPTLTEVVNSQPVVKEEAAPAKAPKKKPAGKKPAGQKPAQKAAAAPKQGGAKKGGRKPKSKPQA